MRRVGLMNEASKQVAYKNNKTKQPHANVANDSKLFKVNLLNNEVCFKVEECRNVGCFRDAPHRTEHEKNIDGNLPGVGTYLSLSFCVCLCVSICI